MIQTGHFLENQFDKSWDVEVHEVLYLQTNLNHKGKQNIVKPPQSPISIIADISDSQSICLLKTTRFSSMAFQAKFRSVCSGQGPNLIKTEIQSSKM